MIVRSREKKKCAQRAHDKYRVNEFGFAGMHRCILRNDGTSRKKIQVKVVENHFLFLLNINAYFLLFVVWNFILMIIFFSILILNHINNHNMVHKLLRLSTRFSWNKEIGKLVETHSC